MASLSLSDRNETTHIYMHTSYGTKAMSRGFSAGAKQVMKSADYKKSLSSLLIQTSRQQKKKTLYLSVNVFSTKY